MLLKKFFVIVILSMAGFACNLTAMQGLIANFYHNLTLKKKKPDYSINLMWINENLKKDQEYIHPSNDEFASTICKWAALNKDGVVNVWYDEEMTTTDAIKNTHKAIIRECSQYSYKALVRLKNVRKLSEVKEHPKAFSDKMPVYFRADLLRSTAGFNHISRNKINYFVYSDLDAEPITEKQLFDEKTKEDLKRYGMVLTRPSEFPGYSGFENSFQIMSNHKSNLLQAKKTALIDLNIKRAYDVQDKNLSGVKSLEQAVYRSYNDMFKYFYHLEGCGEFKVRSSEKTLERYDKDKHGLEPFERHMFFFPRDNCCNGKDFRHGGFIPTKEVNVPLSVHFGPGSHKS